MANEFEERIVEAATSLATAFVNSENGLRPLSRTVGATAFAKVVCTSHRTLQQATVMTLFNLLYTIAEMAPYFGHDLRNEYSTEQLAKFKEFVDNGELSVGAPFI